ncbi:hypothetical protein TNIN_201711 [Trichonephila inaurata madagascariensis]|uniref:Uncharacterized protein n=1 Tax=Trichonephila inaurata madagascariensis TaxID=2747483 RepID=A0A8X6M864_9ARAC|nr:hypothetical protein TNIN_201711 [Trichonephila inaurata madagascariensis]
MDLVCCYELRRFEVGNPAVEEDLGNGFSLPVMHRKSSNPTGESVDDCQEVLASVGGCKRGNNAAVYVGKHL